MPHPPLTVLPGSTSLRTTLGALVVGAWLYAAGFSVYLALEVWPTAQALGEGMQTMAQIDRALGRSHDALERAQLALQPLAHPRPDHTVAADNLPTGDRLAGLQERIRTQMGRAPASTFAAMPPELRVPFARAEQEMADWGALLAEVVAHLRLERPQEALEAYHRTIETHSRVDALVSEARSAGRDELLVRQERMDGTARRATRSGLLWMGGGILLLPLFFLLFRRRVETPLSELEEALERVRRGDLSARAPVLRRDEVGRLALHFNRVTRVLQRRAEAQGRYAAAGELLASIAHEVNNPLMAVSSIAENRLDSDRPLSDDDRADLQEICRQARRAGSLLRGLLRFLRPSDDPGAEADVNETVHETVELISYHFRVREVEPRLSLQSDLPPTRLHPDRLEQVVMNLLSNAVDAVRAVDPPRWISVETRREAGGEILVVVEDNGPGIPEETRAEIFRPFVTSKGEEGTGLGLYISREIVREAGGDLAVEEGAAGGARFVVRLPPGSGAPADEIGGDPGTSSNEASLSPGGPRDGEDGATKVGKTPSVAPAGTSLPPSANESGDAEGTGLADGRENLLGGLRVLVADDEAPIRRALARFLERSGASVHSAGDGVEALTLLERFPVDVVLADLRMPRMDGAELYRRIRADYPELASRTIFLTGDLRELEAGLKADETLGADRMLAKPIDLSELAERIARTAGRGAG